MTLRYRKTPFRVAVASVALILVPATPVPAAATAVPSAVPSVGPSAGPLPEPLGVAVQRALDRDGAGYPSTSLPEDSPPQTKLTAGDGAANDVFGISVALDGDTALVGSVLADVDGNADQGAAYVFGRDGDGWTERAKLTAGDGAAGDQFGFSVFLDGDTAVVSAPSADVDGRVGQGAAWVFTRSGGSWSEQAKLTAGDGAAGDQFGISATVGGDTAVVGGWFAGVGGNQRQGAAWVFTRSGGSWSEQAKLTAADGLADDRFGYAVSVVGDTAAVGAIQGGAANQGAAYLFTRTGAGWQQAARLAATDAQANSQFGISVDLAATADAVLVGAPATTVDGVAFQGAAYEFARDGAEWTERARITAADGLAFDQLGWSVRLAGGAAVLSAPGFDNLRGKAYVVTRTGDGWEEHATLLAADGEPFAEFGFAVALAGDTALVGASRALVDGNFDQGAAYAFTLDLPPPPDPTACDETITGIHDGPLTVAAGTTCLAAGAQVRGEVNVLAGAGLIATAAVVQGPLSAIGATVVDLAFTQVTGPVLVANASHTGSLFGSQVTGSVSLVDNHLSHPGDPGDRPVVVAGNTVLGTLFCAGNTPPPTDLGLPNTATGGALGQCAEPME